MTTLFRGKPLSYWDRRLELRAGTVRGRMRRGLPDELIIAKKRKAAKPNHISMVSQDEVADDFEAYSDLTSVQLEMMRDFELIGKAGKWKLH